LRYPLCLLHYCTSLSTFAEILCYLFFRLYLDSEHKNSKELRLGRLVFDLLITFSLLSINVTVFSKLNIHRGGVVIFENLTRLGHGWLKVHLRHIQGPNLVNPESVKFLFTFLSGDGWVVRWVHVEGRIYGCGPCLNSFFSTFFLEIWNVIFECLLEFLRHGEMEGKELNDR
jgi:hypothetical protein